MADYVLSTTISLKDNFTNKIKNTARASEEFKKKLNEVDRTLDKFDKNNNFNNKSKQIKNLSNTLRLSFFSEQMSKAATSIDQTKIKLENIGITSEKVYKKIDKLGKGFANITGRIAKKGLNIAKWGLIGGTGGLIGATKIGTEFETYRTMLETAVSGSEDLKKLGSIDKVTSDYYKWANNYANKTPFGNDEVISATVKLASYGFDPKKMMSIVGDLAGARGKTLDQAVEAIADASTGELERLKEFGVTKNQIIEHGKKLGFQDFVDNKGTITDANKFMTTLISLVQSKTKGGAEDLSKTLKGQLSTTLGLMKFNIAKFAGITDEGKVRQGSLIDTMTNKFKELNDYLQSDRGQQAISKWVDTFDRAIPQVIRISKSAGNKIKEIFGEDFLSKLQSSIDNFNPKTFNDKLDEIGQHFDKYVEKGTRALGIMAGIQLFRINPYLGVAGVAAGAFLPELMGVAKEALEYQEHRKKLVEEAKKNGTFGEKEIPKAIPWASDEMNKYIYDIKNGNRVNSGIQWNLNNNKTQHELKINVDIKGGEQLNKEEMKKIAYEVFEKSNEIVITDLTDRIVFG